MKFTAIALLSIFGAASAGINTPKLSISVCDGNFDGIDGLDPTLKWEDSSSTGDVDLTYGVEAAARPTKDVASLPRSIWGKASTNISGWGVSARADLDCDGFNSADIEVNADNEENDMSVKLVANVGGESSVKSVEATKGMDMDGARLTVTPRLNLEDDDKDVVVTYNNGDTDVKLTASADNQEVEISHSTGDTDIKLTASIESQELTISQKIDDTNRVAPTINNSGEFSVEYERTLGDDSSVTATLKPNESIDVEWKDDAWTANVNMPLDGTEITGANVGIKRDVSF